MHVILGQSFLVSVDKKMIFLHNEWYIRNVLVCAHFSSKLAHGTYCLCSIKQLFRLLGIVFSNVNTLVTLTEVYNYVFQFLK